VPLHHVGALDLVTTTWAARAMVRAILDVPGIERRDLSSVRVIIARGEKMPIP
jgi:fatty-acyl-CoA synthase